MKNRILFTVMMVLGVGLTACGDSLTNASEPMDSPKPQLGAFFSTAPAPGMTVLRRTKPLKEEKTITGQFSYYETGWLSLPEAGIHIYVPEGAIMTKERTAITLTALAGDAVAFEFAPHGITFAKPLQIRVDVEETEASFLTAQDPSNGMLNNMIGVYYEWNAAGLAVPVEKFPVYWNDMENDSGPGDKHGIIEFFTNHFSGYAIAM